MLAVQVQYWANVETKRHDKVMEDQTERSIHETIQHNRNTEGISQYQAETARLQYQENVRHDVRSEDMTEAFQQGQLAEQSRHNRATELQAKKELALARENLKLAKKQFQEVKRHNKATESNDYKKAQAAVVSAQAAYQNALNGVQQAQAAITQASAAASQAATAAMVGASTADLNYANATKTKQSTLDHETYRMQANADISKTYAASEASSASADKSSAEAAFTQKKTDYFWTTAIGDLMGGAGSAASGAGSIIKAMPK